MVHQFGALGGEQGRLPVMNVFGACCTRHLIPATYRPLCPREALSRKAAWWQQSIGGNQPSLQLLGSELCEVKFGEGTCFCTDGVGIQGGLTDAVSNRPDSSHILFNTTLKHCFVLTYCLDWIFKEFKCTLRIAVVQKPRLIDHDLLVKWRKGLQKVFQPWNGVMALRLRRCGSD